MRALALLLSMAMVSCPFEARAEEQSWATAQAAELTRQARDHAARGAQDTAIARFFEALRIDPTYAPAYLGLAAQYEARGDVREAERTYGVGLDHVPGFTQALIARARLRGRSHRHEDAIVDLETALGVDGEATSVLRELLAAYVATRALPAALSVARRMAVIADAQQDAAAAGEARVKVRALSLLVGEIDPVIAGKTGRGPVRHALSMGAKKR